MENFVTEKQWKNLKKMYGGGHETKNFFSKKVCNFVKTILHKWNLMEFSLINMFFLILNERYIQMNMPKPWVGNNILLHQLLKIRT